MKVVYATASGEQYVCLSSPRDHGHPTFVASVSCLSCKHCFNSRDDSTVRGIIMCSLDSSKIMPFNQYVKSLEDGGQQ